MNSKNIWLVVLVLIIGIVCGTGGYILCRRQFSKLETTTLRDTLITRDTLTITEVTVRERHITDTIRIAVSDTVTIHDTTYIILPKEQVRYSGEDYEAWVSGYRPALDSIRVFPTTTTITNTITKVSTPKRWGIGIQAGYGYGSDGFSPYIGVGISYNVIRF